LKGVELKSTRAELERLTAEAVARGVRTVPAVWTGDDVLYGDAGLDRVPAVFS
jgi:2-hydroxychromene-2-carboxylate isomerase